MNSRNRHVARQLRAALRDYRWDATTLALRTYLSRTTVAKVLTGDNAVALGVYEVVAEELRLNLTFEPWSPSPPPVHGQVESIVDLARKRLNEQPGPRTR